ncbi:9978_t:CDS:2, partial [Racocetra fulgida]
NFGGKISINLKSIETISNANKGKELSSKELLMKYRVDLTKRGNLEDCFRRLEVDLTKRGNLEDCFVRGNLEDCFRRLEVDLTTNLTGAWQSRRLLSFKAR